MTRAEFIDRLKEGLVGLPTTTANDIIADYQTHFDDGIAAGRTGRALGVPDHGGIVWDEMVATWLVLLFTPATLIWQAVAVALTQVRQRPCDDAAQRPSSLRAQAHRHAKAGLADD